MALKFVEFVAIVLAALALVPAGAHLLELPAKIAMSEESYFIVQSIYRGWSLLGIVMIATILVDLALVVMLRSQATPFWFAVAALIGAVAMIVVFFAWTYPANVATGNWMNAPPNWQALRAQWEYSHTAAAVFAFADLCLLAVAILTTGEWRAAG